MHRLIRAVRFAINPFLDSQDQGCNAFAACPAGQGLCLFLELEVELFGPLDERTGFVVNVTDIDNCVRTTALPLFVEHVQTCYRRAQHVNLAALVKLLVSTGKVLSQRFRPASICKLGLKLNPYRKVSIRIEDQAMFIYSEKFEFSATHKLWNDLLSEQDNYRAFGKCASPSGHGHNYLVEISINTDKGSRFDALDFERIVNDRLISALDHKNLNVDVPHFTQVNPTMENIAEYAWNQLAGDFEQSLHCVTVWESDRTSCSYFGPTQPGSH